MQVLRARRGRHLFTAGNGEVNDSILVVYSLSLHREARVAMVTAVYGSVSTACLAGAEIMAAAESRDSLSAVWQDQSFDV